MVISCSSRRSGMRILSPTSPDWPSKNSLVVANNRSPTPCGAKAQGSVAGYNIVMRCC